MHQDLSEKLEYIGLQYIFPIKQLSDYSKRYPFITLAAFLLFVLMPVILESPSSYPYDFFTPTDNILWVWYFKYIEVLTTRAETGFMQYLFH